MHSMLGDDPKDQERTMHTSLGLKAPEVELSGETGKVGTSGRGARKQVEAWCAA